MNKNSRFTISITAAGIAVMLLLIVGTGATTSFILFNTAHAQSATLGEPFFVEKGKDIAQKEIGPNRTQVTFTSNGTMNDNIEVTNTGEFVSISTGNNLVFDRGQGVIKTKDGSETANYTFIEVRNGTAFQGASVFSTNSTGKLSFLNNILGIFKGELDESAPEQWYNEEWLWK
jgi:hypothetical protein